MNYPESMTLKEIRELEGYGRYDDSDYSNYWDDIVSAEVINEETGEPYTKEDYDDFVKKYGYREIETLYDRYVIGRE